MVSLWLLLQFLAPKFRLAYIFQLGFFFLWSLPLVVLGIVFMIIFALHVIRRREVRIAALSILLLLFTVGAVAAEAQGWNTRLQAALFPEKPHVTIALHNAWKATTAFLGFGGTSSTGSTVAVSTSSASTRSSTPAVAVMSSSAMSSSSSRAPIASKPNHLPASGPGDVAAVLAVTLAGFYFGTVHLRAQRRELM
jgi:type IV secretory pathway VirB2 component (pilin)